MKRKLQVFVSGTYTDLKEERQAAVSAILKAGHIPAGMELFAAGDKSQRETIERWIDESDVYMLILGGRYGSVEPTSNISYTELEYDYAVAQGKPVFAIVVEDEALEEKAKTQGLACIEKTNPKELKQFREKVLQKMSSFFRDLKDIRLCVYESLSDLASNPALKGWVSGADVLNTDLLQKQIESLTNENAALAAQLAEAEKKSVTRREGNDFDEIIRILGSIDIKVPAALNSEKKDITNTLLDITFSNKDVLIHGVSNRYDASEAESFLYLNIIPKLQLHGLAESEKVTGYKAVRRGYINKKGQTFLAQYERMLINRKGKDKSTANLVRNGPQQ